MGYKQQTATGRANAYQALVDYLTTDATLVAAGHNWTNAGSFNDGVGPMGTGVYLKSPDNGGVDCYLLICHSYHSSTDSHVIAMRTCFALGVDSATDSYNNPGASLTYAVCAVSDTTTIDCLFIANSRRVCGYFASENNYHNFYTGMFLPYVDPGYYPRPFACIGQGKYENQNVTWDHSGGYWNSISDPESLGTGENNVGASMHTPTGTAKMLHGSNWGTDPIRLWPMFNDWTNQNLCFGRLTVSPGGYYPLLPLVIYEADGEDGGTAALYGELDGVRYAPSIGMIAGRVIQDEYGNDWITTRDGKGTGQNSYAAYRLT